MNELFKFAISCSGSWNDRFQYNEIFVLELLTEFSFQIGSVCSKRALNTFQCILTKQMKGLVAFQLADVTDSNGDGGEVFLWKTRIDSLSSTV